MAQNKVVTLNDATNIASILLNAPSVIGVELIGSVAREGKGNDLDLVVLVNVFRYTSYVVALQRLSIEDPYYTDFYMDFTTERTNAALNTLQMHSLLRGWLKMTTQDFKVDIHLMPQNWQRHTAEVQQHLPHDDADFVSKIAKDARRFTVTVKDGVKQAHLTK